MDNHKRYSEIKNLAQKLKTKQTARRLKKKQPVG